MTPAPMLQFSKHNTKPAVISHLRTFKNSVDKEQKLELWRQLQQVAAKSRGLLLHPVMLLQALVTRFVHMTVTVAAADAM
jgi:hypothetical protein